MFIYSTLSNSQTFSSFSEKSLEQMAPRKMKSVTIEGGANVASRNIIFRPKSREDFDMGVPRVKETRVSEEDFEFLMTHGHFKHYVDKGFMTYDKKKRIDYRDSKSVDNIIKNMEKKSQSAPLTPDDLKKYPGGVKECVVDHM